MGERQDCVGCKDLAQISASYYTAVVDSNSQPYVPIGRVLTEPLNTVSAAGLILFAGILFGVLIPGFFYRVTGTFSSADIANKLPADEKQLWKAHRDNIGDLEKSVGLLDARIADDAFHGSPASDVNALVEERSKLYSLLKVVESEPPFHLAGFYLEPLMVVWPLFYVCIAWLLLLFPPKYPLRWKLGSRLPLFMNVCTLSLANVDAELTCSA
jgi:hypothetical protein